jgi:hypothetical protein
MCKWFAEQRWGKICGRMRAGFARGRNRHVSDPSGDGAGHKRNLAEAATSGSCLAKIYHSCEPVSLTNTTERVAPRYGLDGHAARWSPSDSQPPGWLCSCTGCPCPARKSRPFDSIAQPVRNVPTRRGGPRQVARVRLGRRSRAAHGIRSWRLGRQGTRNSRRVFAWPHKALLNASL